MSGEVIDEKSTLGKIIITVAIAIIVGGGGQAFLTYGSFREMQSKQADISKRLDAMHGTLQGLRASVADRWTKADHNAYEMREQARHEKLEDRVRDLEKHCYRLKDK